MIQLKQNKYILIGGFLAIFGCNSHQDAQKTTALPFINKPDFTPEWISTEDSTYTQIHHIPAFSFTDQDGKTVTERTVEGKIYVANFIFTRCASICPKMTANMKILQDRFAADADVIFLSHSVTPDLYSVSVLKRYANQKGIISGKWHVMTGSQDLIYRLAKKEYYAGDTNGYYQTGNEFLHTENFLLIDKHRRIRGVYNGTLEFEMDRLTEDIRTLQQEE